MGSLGQTQQWSLTVWATNEAPHWDTLGESLKGLADSHGPLGSSSAISQVLRNALSSISLVARCRHPLALPPSPHLSDTIPELQSPELGALGGSGGRGRAALPTMGHLRELSHLKPRPEVILTLPNPSPRRRSVLRKRTVSERRSV